MAVMMVAMLKVGHTPMNESIRVCSVKFLFPRSLILFSTGTRRGSCRGSGQSLSQLVCTRNQLSSLSSQKACTLSTSLSITQPSSGWVPEMMQQTGPPILQVFSLLRAPLQVVSSSSTFLSSQQVGMALSTSTLIRSSQKCLAYRVSTLTAKAPGLMAVRAKTDPTTVSMLNSFLPPRQYSTLAISLDRISHISKSRFLPWMTLPSSVLTRMAVQALKVEYSYMKLMKNIFQKGCPLSLEMASTSATKSLCWYTFLAKNSTPLKKS